MNTPSTDEVTVGQIYTGWGKRWVVTTVWPRERVAEIRNVENPANTARLPLMQFTTEGTV